VVGGLETVTIGRLAGQAIWAREHERLEKLGVVFRMKPTKTGPVTVAVFEDTCGNLVQLVQK
jgi:hypothetical protein